MRWCLYHRADLDGKCSAALVYQHFNGKVTLVGCDYPDSPDDILDILFRGLKGSPDPAGSNDVYIVDFSLPLEQMRLLVEMFGADNVIWLDHHKGPVEDTDPALQAVGFNLPGFRRIGLAGCGLSERG